MNHAKKSLTVFLITTLLTGIVVLNGGVFAIASSAPLLPHIGTIWRGNTAPAIDKIWRYAVTVQLMDDNGRLYQASSDIPITLSSSNRTIGFFGESPGLANYVTTLPQGENYIQLDFHTTGKLGPTTLNVTSPSLAGASSVTLWMVKTGGAPSVVEVKATPAVLPADGETHLNALAIILLDANFNYATVSADVAASVISSNISVATVPSSLTLADSVTLTSVTTTMTPGLTSIQPSRSGYGSSAFTLYTRTVSGESIEDFDFTISVLPSSSTVIRGEKTTFALALSQIKGSAQLVSLAVSGLPAGASGSFNPSVLSSIGTSNLTITTLSTVSPGASEITITGIGGGVTRTATVTLMIHDSSDIIHVPEDYATIQDAINAANAGDTIFIHPGIYYGNIFINKSLALIGNSSTIIDGNGIGTVIVVSVNNVNITGLTIQNSGYEWLSSGISVNSNSNTISNNNIRSTHYGIVLNYSSSNFIRFNNLSDNEKAGVLLLFSSNNSISENLICFNRLNGISLVSSQDTIVSSNFISENKQFGVGLWDSKDNTITHNAAVSNNGDDGIYIYNSERNIVMGNPIYFNGYDGISLYSSLHNTISNNMISNNKMPGILLSNSSDNIIRENTISNNDIEGLYLTNSRNNTIFNNGLFNNLRGFYLYNSNSNLIIANFVDRMARIEQSNNNVIYHNIFMKNSSSTLEVINSQNTWNDSYPSGGNFWDSYTGLDEKRGSNQDQYGSDGIGDSPQIIDYNNRDQYPLMCPKIQ